MSDITDAELELEYQERNKNLKNSFNDLVDSAKEKGQKVADTLQENKDQTSMNNSHSSSSDALNPDTGFGPTHVDRRMMHSIEHDLEAMGSQNAEGFEPIAAKIDENFGNNAMTEL